MRLTCWVAEATTGDVIGELTGVQLREMVKSLTGGRLSGAVHFEVRHDGLDWPAIVAAHGLLTPLERTIIVTGSRTTPDGEVATGPDAAGGIVRSLISEWVLDERQRDSRAGSIGFVALGWEEYLQRLAQPMHQVHDDVNPLIPAASLFRSGFATAAIDVPDAPSPIRGSIDRDAWSGTIADAIAELQEQGGGWEWVIDLVPIWDGERLVRVERTLRWGIPEVTRSDNLTLDAGGWDPPRAGNCWIEQEDEGARWARVVVGVGAGSGGKQVIGYASLDPRPAARLDSTKVVQLSNVTSQAAAVAAATKHAQECRSMAGPLTVEMSLEGQYLPRVGAEPRLIAYRSPSWPSTDPSTPVIDTTVRIGEVSYAVDGSPVVEYATLKVA